jgi:pilus assembly protein CpaF
MTGTGDHGGGNGWPPIGSPDGSGTATDEAAFRELLAGVRRAAGAVLEGRGRVAPGPEDLEAIRVLVDEHVGAHERRAAALGVPGLADPAAVARRLFGYVCGGGPLDALLREPEVEEVIVNGTRVLAVRNGKKAAVEDAGFADEAEVVELVRRLVGPLGKRLDEASPMVEARLPDGARLFAVIAPAASHWCSVNVRRHLLRARTLADLVSLGSVPPAAADFLRAAVQARASILVSGGTSSGKTTLINALGSAIASGSERVVVCEDTPELRLPFTLADCVALQVREDNVEGEGRITLRDLVRAALRMRPDRIILGESRGPEAFDVLHALNSGHEGGMRHRRPAPGRSRALAGALRPQPGRRASAGRALADGPRPHLARAAAGPPVPRTGSSAGSGACAGRSAVGGHDRVPRGGLPRGRRHGRSTGRGRGAGRRRVDAGRARAAGARPGGGGPSSRGRGHGRRPST